MSVPVEFSRNPHILAMLAYLPPAFRRNGKGTVFTGVCLSTFRGGVPPFGWWQGYPLPSWWGYPHPSWQGVPSSFLGNPQSRSEWGVARTGGTPGYPPIQVRSQVRTGEVPPSQVRTGGTLRGTTPHALATRWSVCLSRSHRRTFLLYC